MWVVLGTLLVGGVLGSTYLVLNQGGADVDASTAAATIEAEEPALVSAMPSDSMDGA